MTERDDLSPRLRAAAEKAEGELRELLLEAADELDSMEQSLDNMWYDQQYPRD